MDFLGVGPAEFLVIGLIAFLILGPARMLDIARSAGRTIREIRQTVNEIPELLSIEEPLDQPSINNNNDREQNRTDASKNTD